MTQDTSRNEVFISNPAIVKPAYVCVPKPNNRRSRGSHLLAPQTIISIEIVVANPLIAIRDPASNSGTSCSCCNKEGIKTMGVIKSIPNIPCMKMPSTKFRSVNNLKSIKGRSFVKL